MPRKAAAAPAAASAAPAATAAPAASNKKKSRVNRSEFKYAVWVGNGVRPHSFCKTKEEVNGVLTTVKSSKLSNVTVGTLQQVATKVSADW
jgi:hypothetical protein